MLLRSIGANTLGLKTAGTNAQIKPNGEIRIGEKDIEGPGEYDVAGLGVHAYLGYAVLFTEGVRFAVLWDTAASIDTADEVNIDVFIFLITDVKRINTIIKELDPRLVVLNEEATANEVAEQDGVTVTRDSNYKITSSTLPAEDRQFVLLAP
jgi:hypothetical protein